MIRIDGERGEFAVNSSLCPHELDVVPPPPAKGLIFRREAPRRPRRSGVLQIRRGASPRPKP